MTRIHGGAVKYNYLNKEQSYTNKWEKQAQVKERLAMRAAQFINNAEIIVLDGGNNDRPYSQVFKSSIKLYVCYKFIYDSYGIK